MALGGVYICNVTGGRVIGLGGCAWVGSVLLHASVRARLHLGEDVDVVEDSESYRTAFRTVTSRAH
jgi:hypothetical protein